MVVEYDERVNMRMLRYLHSLDGETLKEYYKCGKNKSNDTFKSQMTALNNYCLSQVEGMSKRRYTYATNKSYGRLYSKGLQGLKKVFRGALCNGIMTDVDIINAHPTILVYLCKKHGIPCFILETYVKSRDEILTEMTETTNISREDAKTLFLVSINEGKPIKMNFPFFQTYDREMKKIQQKLMELDEYQFILPGITDKTNKYGTFINLVMCYYENLILQDTVKYLQGQGHEIAVLMFDGLMVYGNHYHDGELLDNINQFIESKWEYPFKFSYKAHDTTIQIPESCVVTELPTFEQMCENFNQHNCKVDCMYYTHEDTNIESYTKQKFVDKYEHLRVVKKNGDTGIFITDWMKGLDPNLRVYTRADVIPNPNDCPQNVFNLWTPFPCEGYTDTYEHDQVGLNTVLNHFIMICNNEEPVYNFLFDWIAQMIQYPEVKSVCPVLTGEEGSGKGTIHEIITAIVGAQKTVQDAKLANIVGDFNGVLKSKFFVNIDEPGSRDFNNSLGIFKNLITEPTVTINEKGKPQYTIRSYHRFMITTNCEFPVPTHDNDRRFVVIRTNDEKMGNKKYFDGIRSILERVDSVRTLYDYFKTRQTKRVFTRSDLPDTQYHLMLRKASKNIILEWLEDYVIKQPFHIKQTKLSNTDAWESFRTFCFEGNHQNQMNKPAFGTRLGMKRVEGITVKTWKERGLCVNGRVYDLETLRERFEIADIEDL